MYMISKASFCCMNLAHTHREAAIYGRMFSGMLLFIFINVLPYPNDTNRFLNVLLALCSKNKAVAPTVMMMSCRIKPVMTGSASCNCWETCRPTGCRRCVWT